MGPAAIFSELPQYHRPKRRSFGRLVCVAIPLVLLLAIYTSREPLGHAYKEYRRPASAAAAAAAPGAADLGSPVQVIAGDVEPLEDPLATSVPPSAQQTEGAPQQDDAQQQHTTLQTSTVSSSSTSSVSSASSDPAEPTPSGPPVPDDVPIDHQNPRNRLPQDMQVLLHWDPPKLEGHDPPYGTFFMSDYDPNRWEAFEQNTDIFTQGTVGSDARKHEAKPYKPYPAYNSPEWRAEWRGEYVPCVGLRGVPYNESDDDVVKAFKLKPGQFPPPDAGSFEAVGVDGSVCFERDSRLGSVGLNRERDAALGGLNLGQLQRDCLARNRERYAFGDAPEMRPSRFVTDFRAGDNEGFNAAHKAAGAVHKARTAVLIRAWEDYEYEDNDIQAIRSLVSELALQSGGEYQVFLFVHIKDDEQGMFDSHLVYQQKLERSVPAEFWDMTILWSERLTSSIYDKVGEYRVGVMQYMPVQWFMAKYPEFEYVWNWEMDARYIGQTYHFLEALTAFAKRQPRKNLMERNSRFYFQSSFATYEDFFNDTNAEIERSSYVGSMWGPDETLADRVLGPQPPTSAADDDYSWGVGEEADFISLLPIWDPLWTAWGWRHTIFNYDDPFVTRRAYINTHARFSRRLLHAMHEENVQGRCMMAEMWPSSVAMHHGLKAVYAPHPIWFSQRWPAEYKELVFNADGWGAGSFYNESDAGEAGVNMGVHTIVEGRGSAYNETLARLQLPQAGTGPNGEGARARWGQERDSVYNVDREHNFKGWSWYYHSDFGRMLYWRWLGWKQTFSDSTIGWDKGLDAMPDAGTSEWEDEHGRLCLPSMMLHPVKHVTPEHERPEAEAVTEQKVPDMPPEGQRVTPQQEQEQQEELQKEKQAEAAADSAAQRGGPEAQPDGADPPRQQEAQAGQQEAEHQEAEQQEAEMLQRFQGLAEDS